MIKLIKLIYVNILGLFDFNEMIVAKNSGVKSSVQNRNILYALSGLLMGYIIYVLLTNINLEDKYYILVLGYVLSFVICFINDFMIVGNSIFKSEDNELLFSLPIDRNYIIFSKLFNVYIKNLLFVSIIMISSFLAFSKFIKVSETLGLVVLVSSLLVPCIPIVITSMIVYFDNLLSFKYGRTYKLIRILTIFILMIGLYFVGRLVGIEFFVNNMLYIFPMNYLFFESIVNYNIICFIALVIISILFVYLYSLLMNYSYLKIVSSLKGVAKKSKFKYKKKLCLGKLFGTIRKDFYSLINNKKYFFNSFSVNIVLAIMLFAVAMFYSGGNFDSLDYFLKFWMPNLLGMIAALGNSTIYSISFEKDGRLMSGTMPVGLFRYLFSKWFINVLMGSLFVLINGSLVTCMFKLSGFKLVIVYLLPFVSLMLNSLIGLFLDAFFVVKNCNDDNVIMKQRVVTLVPSIVALLIGFLPMFTSNLTNYVHVQGAYVLVMLIIMFILLIAMIIKRKKISQKIFY